MRHTPHEGQGHGMHGGRERTLAEISVTVWLTPENASFSQKNGLLYLTVQEKEQRVTLCRQFPFDMSFEYISVLDEDSCELGIIRNTEIFEGNGRDLIEDELKKRYYAPTVLRVLSVKERFGFSYWQVETPEGKVKFTLRDTFRSIFSVNGKRVIFTDVDGNRFEIPDADVLDAKSRRRLELYL